MAEATRTGIVANFNVVLNQINGVNDTSRKFFRGLAPAEATITIEHVMNGGVLMNSMGEAEFGAAGKIINVWLKERLYNAGMVRLAERAALEEAGKPVPDYPPVAVIMDEAQSLVTRADPAFYAQSREAEVFLSMATQSISSIVSVLGEADAMTLLQLMTSMVFLKTKDKPTIDYAVFRAGSFPHAYSAEENLYATQTIREAAVPDVAPGFAPATLLSSLAPSIPGFALQGMSSAIEYDGRFIQRTGKDSGSDGGASAAAWRFEDKNREALIQGIQERPAISMADLSRGQGFAVAIVERAGISRCDIIDLKGLRLQEEAAAKATAPAVTTTPIHEAA